MRLSLWSGNDGYASETLRERSEHGRAAEIFWAMCSLFTRFQLKKRLRLKKGRMWSAGPSIYGIDSGLAAWRVAPLCAVARPPPPVATATHLLRPLLHLSPLSAYGHSSAQPSSTVSPPLARCAAASSRAARVASRRSTPLDAAQRRSTRARLRRSSRDTHHHARRRLTADCAPSAPHTCRVVHCRKGIDGRRHGRSTSARRPRDEQRPTSARPRDEQRSTSRLSCRVNDLRVGGDGSTVMSASAVVSGSERQRAAASGSAARVTPTLSLLCPRTF